MTEVKKESLALRLWRLFLRALPLMGLLSLGLWLWLRGGMPDAKAIKDAVLSYADAKPLLVALFMILLALLVRKRETDGTLAAVFLVLAGAGTTVLEGLREKAFLPVFGGTSLLQAAGIAMIAAGIPAVIHQVRKKKNEPLPDDHSYRKGKRAP